MSEYIKTTNQKVIGTERILRGEITISQDYDFNIAEHLTAVMGYDIETERTPIGAYNGCLKIKVYEVVRRELVPDKKY